MPDYIAINASPRKKMNTSAILHEVIAEIEKSGNTVKSYNLYDLSFKGCLSCFACKREKSPTYGTCVVNDDLKALFEEIKTCKGLVLASPIYFRDVTGEMRVFIERLLFQNMLYSNPPRSTFGKRIKVGIIYTMNVMEEQFNKISLKAHLEGMEGSINLVLGEPKIFYGFGTNQLTDYDGIEYTYINKEERLKRHKEVFPTVLEQARGFGKALL